MAHLATGTTEVASRSVLLATLWRARWVLLVAVLLSAAVGYLVSATRPPTYAAGSRIVFSASQPFRPMGEDFAAQAGRYTSTQVAIINSRPVLEAASAALQRSASPKALAAGLEVAASGNDDVITVTVTAPTAAVAADRANAIVTAYRDRVTLQVRDEATAAAAATRDPALADRIRTAAAAFNDGVALVDPAVPPAGPSAPAPVRDALILAVVAGLVTAGVVLWRRPRVVEGGAWTRADRPSILGAVLALKGQPGRTAEVDPEEHALTLVALDYARQGSPGPVFITSTGWRSGAASVAHGLAVSAAARGQRVLVVDAEPESRELVGRVSGPTRPRHTLDALLRPGVPTGEVLLPIPTVPGLFLGTLGVSGDHGAVDQGQVERALKHVERDVDLVLVQVGPVSASPFAFALVGQPGQLIAVTGESENPAELVVLRERLVTAQRKLIGLVLTRRIRTGIWDRLRPTPGPRSGSAATDEPEGPQTSDSSGPDGRPAARSSAVSGGRPGPPAP